MLGNIDFVRNQENSSSIGLDQDHEETPSLPTYLPFLPSAVLLQTFYLFIYKKSWVGMVLTLEIYQNFKLPNLNLFMFHLNPQPTNQSIKLGIFEIEGGEIFQT
jgi:hypothetical protein